MLDKITGLIKPILENNDVELIELTFRRESGRQVIRLLVDKEGGITLGDCAELNQKIGEIMEAENVIQEKYLIEVDSPGIDRWFQAKRDYERARGRTVRITLNEAVVNKKEYIGMMEEVGDNSIKIDAKKKGVIEIPFEKILRARQEVEF